MQQILSNSNSWPATGLACQDNEVQNFLSSLIFYLFTNLISDIYNLNLFSNDKSSSVDFQNQYPQRI